MRALTPADAQEFEGLALRYRRLIMAIVCRITGSVTEAEDLTQQALMKAFVNYSSFGGRSALSTWLISIARNEALMWRRRAQRTREVAMAEVSVGENSPSAQIDFMDSRPNPEITFLQKERINVLFSELETLKPSLREALELCDLHEHSGLEAAATLGISAAGLKSRKFRGRAVLRRRLESRLLASQNRLVADASSPCKSIHDREDERNRQVH
jgi:RNA polymerase sigma-70 factor, ECF subfamily